MQGIVTVYADGEKIYEDTNVLTDAGGEIIAEAMSVSPSLSGIASASALLDASNYTIKAISFGKGSDAYRALDTNAHLLGATVKHYNLIRNGAHLNSPEKVYAATILAAHTYSGGALTITSPLGASGTFHPVTRPPDSPFPTDTRLERGGTNVSGAAVLSGGSLTLALSSVLPDNGEIGQNLNLGPSSYANAILSKHPEWDGLSSSEQLQLSNLVRSHIGCYADSSGSTGLGDPTDPFYRKGSLAYLVSSYDDIGPVELEVDSVITSSVYSGYFNSAASMDTSGFVTMISTGVADVDNQDSTSGLIISAVDDFNFSSTGRLSYKVTIASGDVGAAQMYGGIYTMGLWGFDVPAILEYGGSPPFGWNPVYNKRKYKLFSKKSFNKNICHATDTSPPATAGLGLKNPKNIVIAWTIDFFGPQE